MKTPLVLAGLLALALAAGCATSESGPGAGSASEIVPYEASGSGGPAPEGNVQAGQEWDELMRRLRDQQGVTQQEKQAQAEEHYRLAERYYKAGDFEKAEVECQKAIMLNPNHGAAHALLVEVQFAMGKGRATPESLVYENYLREAVVRQQEILLEIQNSLDEGVRAYNMGQYDAAERSFRRILEYTKWLPTGVELEAKRREAADLLERTKIARKQKEIDEEYIRRQMIEEEKARDEIRKKIEQRKELELLFGQAQLYFEREAYNRCIEVCDKILYIDPRLAAVEEMKLVAQRLRHSSAERENLKLYVEEWKRTFENIDRLSVVQADELTFPARELWLELISRRRPKGVLEEEDLPEQDQLILEKLRTVKIDLAFENGPLNQIIDYVRDISGLNVLIDTKVIPDPTQETYTIRLRNLPIASALDVLFQGRGRTFVVEDGVVLITTTEAVRKRVRLELYDVQDLTFALRDFPGVNISLTEEGIGGLPPEEGEVEGLGGEQLADLIKNTIDKTSWDESQGVSILYQNGLLIVRNAIETHRKIRKFLSDLRASTGILVSVETRFLTVENDFLQQVGMDFRDVDGARVTGILNLDDISPLFSTIPGSQFSTFVDPRSGGPLFSATPGIAGSFGKEIVRNMGARVQHIMTNDILLGRFYQNALAPLGGASLQYTLLDDISLEAIVRMVSRSTRAHTLAAPKLTLFNTQRGNFRISNQFSYIRDFDIQVALGAVAIDPIPAVVNDGISLDVRPIVSADRRFVTLELRPTIATLFPAPPNIFTISVNSLIPDQVVSVDANYVIETPWLNMQSFRTTVVIPDRGTLLLGGLTTFFEENAESAIPLWRNIPILGNLGSEKVKGLSRRQLLTLLRARIIIPDEEERRRFD